MYGKYFCLQKKLSVILFLHIYSALTLTLKLYYIFNNYTFQCSTSHCLRCNDSIVASSIKSSNPCRSFATNYRTGCWKCLFQTTSVYSTNGTPLGRSFRPGKFLFPSRLWVGLTGSFKQQSKFGTASCLSNKRKLI